jgi:hypothetical protein
MAFFTAFGLAGEKTLDQSAASPNGARAKPSAATKRTASGKYGLETML